VPVIKKGEKLAKKEINSRKFSDYEVIELGKELVKWVRDRYKSSDLPFHLTEWYFIEKELSYEEWDGIRKRVHFLQYYNTALDMMALFTQKNEKLSTAYGSRFLGIYSKDLRQHEKDVSFEKIDHEAEVKAKADIGKQIAPNDDKLERLIISLDALKKDKE